MPKIAPEKASEIEASGSYVLATTETGLILHIWYAKPSLRCNGASLCGLDHIPVDPDRCYNRFFRTSLCPDCLSVFSTHY